MNWALEMDSMGDGGCVDEDEGWAWFVDGSVGEWNGVGWNGVEWNEMVWYGMVWDEVEWDVHAA